MVILESVFNSGAIFSLDLGSQFRLVSFGSWWPVDRSVLVLGLCQGGCQPQGAQEGGEEEPPGDMGEPEGQETPRCQEMAGQGEAATSYHLKYKLSEKEIID